LVASNSETEDDEDIFNSKNLGMTISKYICSHLGGRLQCESDLSDTTKVFAASMIAESRNQQSSLNSARSR